MALESAQPRGRYYVEALGRGLALLDCFIADPGPHSLIELSRRVRLGLPTTLRLIRTLEEAGARGGETTGMAALDGTEVRLAIRVSSTRIISANMPPGSLFPPHATAMGKVLLAGLEPAVVRELAARRPFERFTPTTITCVDQLLGEQREVADQEIASKHHV